MIFLRNKKCIPFSVSGNRQKHNKEINTFRKDKDNCGACPFKVSFFLSFLVCQRCRVEYGKKCIVFSELLLTLWLSVIFVVGIIATEKRYRQPKVKKSCVEISDGNMLAPLHNSWTLFLYEDLCRIYFAREVFWGAYRLFICGFLFVFVYIASKQDCILAQFFLHIYTTFPGKTKKSELTCFIACLDHVCIVPKKYE